MVSLLHTEEEENLEVQESREELKAEKLDISGFIKIPQYVINNTAGLLIIKDLKTSQNDAFRMAAPKGGEPRIVYDIKAMFGEKILRASAGLQEALRNGLLKEIKQGDTNPPVTPSIRDRIEAKVGKVPARRTRKKGEKVAGLKDKQLEQEIIEHVQTPNEFDERLVELREQLDNDVIE